MSEICGVRMTTAALFCDGPAGHTGAHFHRTDLTPQTRVEQYETIISLLTALAEELRREKAAHETLAYNQVQLQRAVESLDTRLNREFDALANTWAEATRAVATQVKQNAVVTKKRKHR